MKKILLTIMIMLMLTVSTTAISVDKIYKDDKWKYKDKDNIEFDEEAIDILLFGNIAVAKIDTNRSYPLAMSSINYTDLSFELEYNQSVLYVTQLGAIPLLFDGVVSGNVTYGDYSTYINNSHVLFDYGLETDNPSESIVTNEPTSFQIMFFIPFNNTVVNFDNGLTSTIKITIDMTISSLEVDTEFTIEYNHYRIHINDYENDFIKNYDIIDGLSLSSNLAPYMFIMSDSNTIPIYIAQTEPVNTYGLSLSQSTELIEYFLVQDEIVSESSETPFMFLPVFIIIPILIRKFRNL